MKQISSLLIFFLACLQLQSQSPNGSSRSSVNPYLFPFYHGVASGDPLADRVILWTRITLDIPMDPVSVNWEIATDTSFSNIINNGTVSTDSTKDYTIKVDATGLQQNTWYYYRFIYDTLKSVIGRTRTLPTGTVNNVRFAVASCQDYQDGFYNAHRHLSQRNDIDAVLFLGDYTYEGGENVNAVGGRLHEPSSKTIQLSDYRIRQSLYHLDADLQEAHRQYPWICVWDDHETANNSYTNGAKNHNQVNDGAWYDRKVNGVETYEAWMPIRMPDVNDTFKIFRKFTWGNLADLHMLDTRLYDRDKQVVGGQFIPINDSTLTDSTRNMLGPVQFDWLEQNLDSSTAQWQILGQQVMMAPLVIPQGFQPTAVIVNPDQWDGYPYDRKKLYDHILNNNIQNMVVLTGDIHTSWANDLPLSNYDTLHRQNSAGVEFVGTSITSGNELNSPFTPEIIMGMAPYIRYVDLTQHGYYILDINAQRTQGDFVYVSDVTTQTYTTSTAPSWYVNSGERFLRQANSPAVAQNTYPILAPITVQNTSLKNLTDNITTISVHPNPFYDEVLIQFNSQVPEEVALEVFSSTGKIMTKKNLGTTRQGLNYTTFNGNNFPSGFYIVELKGKSHSVGKAVIKVN